MVTTNYDLLLSRRLNQHVLPLTLLPIRPGHHMPNGCKAATFDDVLLGREAVDE